MKWSMFIFKVEKKNQILLYNTYNHAIVLFNKEEYARVNTLLSKKELDNENIKELINQGFLVPSELNEQEAYMKDLKQQYKDDPRMCVQILPTTACNFKCPYCYQEGICRDKSLDENTVDLIHEFMDNYIEKNSKIKKIHLVLHGGEPTLNWAVVEKIFEVIRSLCNKYELEYDTQIVTNGYLLDKNKIALLVENNLRNVQITVDGVRDIHEKRRISKSGVKTFEKILSNIHEILNTNTNSKINIRINYDKGNVENVEETIKFLRNEFSDKRVKVTLGYITKTLDELESNEYINKYGISLNELVNYYPKMHKLLREYDYEPEEMFAFDGLCVSKLRHNIIIDPTGKIYKCPSGVGTEEFVESDIREMKTKIKDYTSWELYDYCFKEKCPFIPVCHTSCRFISKAKYGDMNVIDCKRSILTKINDIILTDQFIE